MKIIILAQAILVISEVVLRQVGCDWSAQFDPAILLARVTEANRRVAGPWGL